MTWLVSRWRPLVSTGLGSLIMIGAIGLICAFTMVLFRAVERGEERHRADAALWRATWQCNALHQRDQRRLCLMQLQLPSPDVTTQPGTDALTVSDIDRSRLP